MKRTHFHFLATLRGCTKSSPETATPCAICGESPFPVAGPAQKVLGRNFCDWHLLLKLPDVCEGCKILLAGRPGDNPPPLRTQNILVVDGQLSHPSGPEMWAAIRDMPGRVQLISWARSRQKHHWLHCAFCTESRLIIGSDDGPIEYIPGEHSMLADAVQGLLSGPTPSTPILTRTAVITGNYHPKAVQRFGLARWEPLEAIVSRWRPSLLLEFLATICPIKVWEQDTEEAPMFPETDLKSARLLAQLVNCSKIYRRDPKLFWGGFMKHRLERYKYLDLRTMISRLMDALSCDYHAPDLKDVLQDIDRWSEAEVREVEEAVRHRTSLILALGYDILRGGHYGKKDD